MKKVFFLATISLIYLGCSSSESSKQAAKTDVDTTTGNHSKTKEKDPIVITRHEDKGVLITNGLVGRYKLGRQLPIPYPEDDYRIKKEVNNIQKEGENIEEITFKVTEGGIHTLTIIPTEGENPNKVLRTMSELYVLVDKYKTGKGIGVGSTIEDFIKQYPEYSLWYTYVSNRFVLETPHLQAQFLLDSKDFVGKKNNSSDKQPLKKEDFKPDSKIITIRVY